MGKRVCIVGSGNWGSAIAKIIGNNVQSSSTFEKIIQMYMYEETIDGQKLTDIVNIQHENIKYLPGVRLPDNVVANPDVLDASTDADIFVFVLPHQFVKGICTQLKGKIKPDAIAVSLIKGVSVTDTGIQMISEVISYELGIPCAAMMGANLAGEVAQEQFCESTLGCTEQNGGAVLKELFETSYFRIRVVSDTHTVEMCGALKNVVAIGAGIVDGMGMGDNTKAAVLRLGLMEMVKFTKMFTCKANISTFFESCGISDLVATCHGGRNRLLGENVIKTNKSVRDLEKELLKGQSFQGPLVAREIFYILEKKNLLDEYPLFVAIHRICQREMDPRDFIVCLRDHPEHL